MTHKSDNMAQSMKDKRGEAMECNKTVIGVTTELHQKANRRCWWAMFPSNYQV